jgi:outer membrane biosynthesis protein TonB
LTDPLSDLAKKRKNASLPAPEKISTHFTKSKPSSPPLTPPKAHRVQAPKAHAQKVQPQRVQATQVKPVQAKQKQQLRAQQAQTQAYNPNDFKFHTSIDYVGINILIKYQDFLVHQFVLPAKTTICTNG